MLTAFSDTLNSVDFIDKSDGTVVFRTCPREKPFVVLQIGTNDPSRAAMVAKLVYVEYDLTGVRS